jgi:ABC-type amino acid transport substrate-binding protein
MSVVAADILQAIAQLLLASAAAPLIANRIRPLSAATTDVLPLLTYQEAAGETFDHMTGSATWEKITLQLDAFAADYATAKSILAALKGRPGNPGALHNFRGVVGNVTIGIARWKDDFDATEAPDIGQETPIIRLQSNYQVIFHC